MGWVSLYWRINWLLFILENGLLRSSTPLWHWSGYPAHWTKLTPSWNCSSLETDIWFRKYHSFHFSSYAHVFSILHHVDVFSHLHEVFQHHFDCRIEWIYKIIPFSFAPLQLLFFQYLFFRLYPRSAVHSCWTASSFRSFNLYIGFFVLASDPVLEPLPPCVVLDRLFGNVFL